MTLWKINNDIARILDQADPETGEINADALDALEVARREKIEATACYLKELAYEIDKFKTEAQKISARRKVMENKYTRLKEYLTMQLEPGEKMATPRAALTWRRSESLEIDPDRLPQGYMRDRVVTEPDRDAVKAAIKSGKEVPGAQLIAKSNLIIK